MKKTDCIAESEPATVGISFKNIETSRVLSVVIISQVCSGIATIVRGRLKFRWAACLSVFYWYTCLSVRFDEYTQRLRERLRRPLPGREAQRRMTPRGRLRAGYESPPRDARYGAVLILLLPPRRAGSLTEEAGPAVPLIARIDDGTAHGGQIGLPGGGFEEGDDFPVGTALREAEEEIAASPEKVAVLGRLTPLYISVSNYHITPVVGTYAGRGEDFRPNPAEVDAVVLTGVDEMIAGRTMRTVDARGLALRVPAYVTDTAAVWGATAMMLSEFFVVHLELTEG